MVGKRNKMRFFHQVKIMNANIKRYKTESICNKTKCIGLSATVRKTNRNLDRGDTYITSNSMRKQSCKYRCYRMRERDIKT